MCVCKCVFIKLFPRWKSLYRSNSLGRSLQFLGSMMFGVFWITGGIKTLSPSLSQWSWTNSRSWYSPQESNISLYRWRSWWSFVSVSSFILMVWERRMGDKITIKDDWLKSPFGLPFPRIHYVRPVTGSMPRPVFRRLLPGLLLSSTVCL